MIKQAFASIEDAHEPMPREANETHPEPTSERAGIENFKANMDEDVLKIARHERT